MRLKLFGNFKANFMNDVVSFISWCVNLLYPHNFYCCVKSPTNNIIHFLLTEYNSDGNGPNSRTKLLRNDRLFYLALALPFLNWRETLENRPDGQKKTWVFWLTLYSWQPKLRRISNFCFSPANQNNIVFYKSPIASITIIPPKKMQNRLSISIFPYYISVTCAPLKS